MVVFRDLYDLLDWAAEYPAEQSITLAPGTYLVTLCSEVPASGVLGDHQEIEVYVEGVDDLPAVDVEHMPTLIF